MTFTITAENLYLGIIVLLMIMQIYQWKSINDSKKEIDKIWDQIKLLTHNIAIEILQLKKQKDDEKSTGK